MRTIFKNILLFISLFALCFDTACFFNKPSTIDPYFAPGFHFNEASLTLSPNLGSNDFGYLAIFDSEDRTYIVTNSGDRRALNLSSSFSSSGFEFKGGTYPGIGGTCTNSLAAHSTCTLVISFSPVISTSFTSDLSLSYDDGLNGTQSLVVTLTGSSHPVDTTAPTAGTFSATTSVTHSAFTLNWSAGIDDYSSASDLQYLVCNGASAIAISTVSGCLSGTVEMNWTTATTSYAVTGKNHSTTYYYNVLVKDENGNTAVYGGTSQATLNAFISSWKTDNAGTSASNQITLPLEATGTYNFTVNWGDSSSSTITAWNDSAKTHTYSATGTYTVTITGSLIGFRFNNGGDRRKLLSISQWGTLRLGNSSGYFYGATNLTITATDVLDLTGTTNLSHAFRQCTSLTTVPSMNSWDTSAVTNMSYMFYVATTFNQNIGSWNTAAVTNMSVMFYQATAFNQNIGSWNTAAVTNMSAMFQNATTFNQDIGSWNTAAVTNISFMFYQATAFNQNIGSWNTVSVTDMSFMFRQATTFNQNIGSWNTAAVTNMSYMFYQAAAFNQNIGSWNTAAVTNMEIMFYQATTFNQNIGSWNTAVVTNMSGMFAATAFNQNIGSWNTAAVTNMSSMFYQATAFNQNIGSWNTAAVTDMSFMFYGATAFNQNIGPWTTAAVTIMSYMFYQATTFNQNIGSWNTAAVTTMSYMFYSATNFGKDIGSWNTGTVTDMSYMFFGATVFNQNIGSWNTASVTNMTSMFESATAFNQNIGSWNTAAVTDMSNMFFSATVFNQNIGAWNTAAVTTMFKMFVNATAFNQNLGSWDVSLVDDMEAMLTFSGLSQANYDSLLIGWSALTLKPGISFGCSITYTGGGAANVARDFIITNFSWTITDGGAN